MDEKQKINDLLYRMNDKRKSPSSTMTISYKAHREAEEIDNISFIPYLEFLISISKNKEERKNIYFLLSCIGKNSECVQVSEILINRLKFEDDKYVLSSLLDCIGRQNDINDIEEVYNYLRDSRWQVRHSAIQALGISKSSEVEDVLLDLIDSTEDYNDISYALSSLYEVGTQKSIPRLIKLLDYPKEEIKGVTLSIISKVGNSSHLPIFLSSLQQRSSYVKWMAMVGVNKYGDESAIEQVYSRVKNILSRKRATEQLPKSELLEAIEYLARYINCDDKVKKLFNIIKENKWGALYKREKNYLVENIEFFSFK